MEGDWLVWRPGFCAQACCGFPWCSRAWKNTAHTPPRRERRGDCVVASFATARHDEILETLGSHNGTGRRTTRFRPGSASAWTRVLRTRAPGAPRARANAKQPLEASSRA